MHVTKERGIYAASARFNEERGEKFYDYLDEGTLKRTEVRAPLRDANAAVKSDTMVARLRR